MIIKTLDPEEIKEALVGFLVNKYGLDVIKEQPIKFIDADFLSVDIVGVEISCE